MSSLQINTILGQLDELRALFVLGQRAVPFLEEMFVFLKDISALIDDINASIRESTVKMMPHATSRLESVSQATEMATTEILDLVDAALGNVWKLKKRLGETQQPIDAIAKADAHMIRLLRAGLRDKDDTLLAKVELIHHEKKALRRKAAEQIQADVDVLDVINEKLNHIMIALQVQDITAQQLAAVNHLIESIRDRMGNLMTRLGAGITFEDKKAPPRRFSAFDPNAKYDKSGAKQRAADAVIASFADPRTAPVAAATPLPSSPASQDDIDLLFGGGGVSLDSSGDSSGDSAPAALPLSPASQDDIDLLFGGGGVSLDSSGESAPAAPPSSLASQDDIDQLFGGGGAPTQSVEDRPPVAGSAPPSQDAIDQLFSPPGGGFASQDDIDKLFGA